MDFNKTKQVMSQYNIYDYDTMYLDPNGSSSHSTQTMITNNTIDVNDPINTITLGNSIYNSSSASGVYTITTQPNTTGIINSPYVFDSITGIDTTTQHGLSVKGDAKFDGKIILGDKDIGEVLDKIEQRLAILHPNKELEEKWERLKSLGDMYRELEKEILSKEEIYSILKK